MRVEEKKREPAQGKENEGEEGSSEVNQEPKEFWGGMVRALYRPTSPVSVAISTDFSV